MPNSVTLNTTVEQRAKREQTRTLLLQALDRMSPAPMELGIAHEILRDTGDWSIAHYKATNKAASTYVLRAFNLKD